jgi:oligopeptide transport system substrate-binding protein
MPRQSIIDNIAQADQIPATGFTPEGMPGYEDIKTDFLQPTADMERAEQLMSEVQNPVKDITLFLNDSPGHKDIAVAIQSMWKPLGINVTIKQQEWAQMLEFLGPPPNAEVDAFRLAWIADFPDAINFLELWTCKSGNNNTTFCDPEYDQMVAQARKTADEAERTAIYKQLEEKLTGEAGAMPIMPIYHYTYVNLEKASIKDSFEINQLDQFDLSKVVVKEG